MRFLGGLVFVFAVLAGLWIWLSRDEPETAEYVQPVYATIEEAFARREEILREVLAEPALVEGHIAIAAGILNDNDWMFERVSHWRLENVEAQRSELVFNLEAREPLKLSALSPEAIKEQFTQDSYRLICDTPETAVIWDIHARMFEIDGRVTMRVVIWDDVVVREFPVDPVPCTNRRTLSAG